MADLVIKRNDLLPALVMVCRDSIGPVDLAGATALFRMVNVLNGEVKIPIAPATGAATIITDPTFTADATTNTLNSTGHGLNNEDDVTLKSSGTLPGGLSNSKRYFVINAVANSLQLSLTLNGSAVDITDTGTGTHTLLTGKVQYEWITGDTDTPGTFFGEIQTTVASKQLTYPNHRNLLIEVTSDLV